MPTRSGQRKSRRSKARRRAPCASSACAPTRTVTTRRRPRAGTSTLPSSSIARARCWRRSLACGSSWNRRGRGTAPGPRPTSSPCWSNCSRSTRAMAWTGWSASSRRWPSSPLRRTSWGSPFSSAATSCCGGCFPPRRWMRSTPRSTCFPPRTASSFRATGGSTRRPRSSCTNGRTRWARSTIVRRKP